MKSKKKSTHAQWLKGMAKIYGKNEFEGIKLPIKRNRPKGLKYDRKEDRLRPLIIKQLKASGFTVKRIENSICGKTGSGIPDLWVAHYSKSIAGWIEIKAQYGVLSPLQADFRDDCRRCGVNWWLVRSQDDVKKILDKP